MDDNGPDTIKIKNIEAINELEYVQIMYDRALSRYLNHPSWENRAIFLEANKRLIETRWAYQKGRELLLERDLRISGFSQVGGRI